MSVEAMKRWRDVIRSMMPDNLDDVRKESKTYQAFAEIDAAIKAAQPEPMSDERIEEAVQRGMRLAWQLGQTYWQQADSESWKQNAMAKETIRKFDALLTETVALLSAQPDGWVSVPREPTPEMWDAAWNSIGLPYRAKLSMHEIKTLFDKFHSAMLAAAPKETK